MAARRRGPGRGGREQGELAFYPWLLIVYPPISNLAAGQVRPVLPTALGVATFAILYVLCIRLSFRDRRRAAAVALAGLLAVSFLLLAGFAHNWFYLAPLMTIACGVVLRGRSVYLLLTVLTLALVAVMWRAGASWANISLATWGTTAGGLVVSIVLKLFSVITELQETREELARVAVAEERLRFSRDLHDLLGHTLSVMVVKAEAVRRLAPATPRRRRGRRPTSRPSAGGADRGEGRGHRLPGPGARRRAGLGAHGPGRRGHRRHRHRHRGTAGTGGRRPAGLGRAGGVTNVVRHSAADSCEIILEGTMLEIRDDGRGRGGSPLGNGLRGLTERAVALGGTLETHDRDGFLLRVTLP